jgi:hypothetical protein
MARSTRAGKEFTELQEIKRKNQKLQRQISALRKQLSRIDVDRYQELRKLVDQQEAEDRAEECAIIAQKVDKAWKCWNCAEGTLRPVFIERRDKTVYWRACDYCKKRTKTKTCDSKEGVINATNEKAPSVESCERDEDPTP